MALPFILGIAVGVGAVIAFNQSDKLKEKITEFFDKSKELADETLEKTKKNLTKSVSISEWMKMELPKNL